MIASLIYEYGSTRFGVVMNSKQDLTKGPIASGLLSFALPMFFGQLLQQLYSLVDAWVVGNFANDTSFAAISSTGSTTFFVIGFFNGVATGGGVVISKYLGAKNYDAVDKAKHTCFLFGIISSIIATVFAVLASPLALKALRTPPDVYGESLTYLRIYFGGVSTIIMYNICMSIMRALGDSKTPLYYLILSSIINVGLDLLFVTQFHMGVAGAGLATVIAQGISVALCIYKMASDEGIAKLEFDKIHYYPTYMKEMIEQGLPSGIQNSVISIGNIVVQSNINSFGTAFMTGVGSYSKVEGFVFLPITSMSMAIPTFISQNLGAKEYGRAKKGALFGILSGAILAELIGVIFYFFAPIFIGFFGGNEQEIAIGVSHARRIALFYDLLAFSHCAAGVLRGCGKSVIPMVTMLAFWCGFRILYVTVTLKVIHHFAVISYAYPITWALSTIVFLTYLSFSDWTHNFDRKNAKEKIA